MLLLFVMLVATCGLMYELILGTLSSYLIGNSVLQFSLTIGLFMTGMGIGAYLSRFFSKEPIKPFFFVEIILSLLGGLSVLFLKTYYIASNFETITFYILFVLITLLIGLLVGFEIPLVHSIHKKLGIQKNHIVSDLFTFDFMGALIASVSFPLIFLVHFGLYYTAIFTGFINLIVATAFIFEIKKYGLDYRKLLIYPLAVLGIFGLAIYAKPYSENIFFQKFFKEPVVYAEHSPYSEIVLTKKGEDFRMYLDGNLQFMSLDEDRYHEALIDYPLKLFPEKQLLNVLIMGGGDGLAIRNLLEDARVYKITLVDIDNKVIELAKTNTDLINLNEASLWDERLEIITKDAFTHLLKEDKNKYDFIIADFPDPRNVGLAKLYSKEFYAMTYRSLKPQGIFVTQSSNAFFASKSMKSVENTIKSIYDNSKAYHRFVPSFGDWGFIMARKGKEIEDEFCENRFCETFDYEYDNIEAEINTLTDPKILEYYREGYRKFSL